MTSSNYVKCACSINRGSLIRQIHQCTVLKISAGSDDLPDSHRFIHSTSTSNISTTMAAIDEALEFLKSSESINYAKTAGRFNCDETTLRRRHRGKQRSRRDADSLYKSRLSKQQERELIAYIHKLSSRGIPPTLTMIKNFAQDKDVSRSYNRIISPVLRVELMCVVLLCIEVQCVDWLKSGASVDPAHLSRGRGWCLFTLTGPQ